jgi:hypothetical protein
MIMKYPTWSQFINNHPDCEDLCNLSDAIISMFDPSEDPNINISKLTTTNSLVVVTLDPFSKQLTPMFYHHCLGLPILNQKPRLLALTGFRDTAITLEIDAKSLFSATETEITTPSLAQFMSFHDKDSEQLKSITVDDNEKDSIKVATILPPDVTVLLASSKTTCPWVLLFQAITVINKMKTESPSINLTEENEDLSHATPFLPLLQTLWSFTQSTEETKAINHPQRSICIDPKASNWNKQVHDVHIAKAQNLPPTYPTQNAASETITEGINHLAKIFRRQDK